jgi:ferredoxin
VATPVFIQEPAKTERLIFNQYCHHNLATYLNRIEVKGKIGIVAKGCDARSIVGLIKERQIEREKVFIIGVPCPGMVNGNGVFASCKVCQHKNPPIYDELIGSEVEENKINEFKEIEEFEKKAPDERWEEMSRDAAECIRCYACRQSCPNCYCTTCFVDQTQPAWFGKSVDPMDTLIFHLIRTFHMAGRCVDCGACERACPMGIKLRKLTKKIEKVVKERFGYTAGLDLEEPPPLATFKLEDPEEFIM